MSAPTDWSREIDSSFGRGSDRPVETYARLGRRAQRRRRALQGSVAGLTVATMALAGPWALGWWGGGPGGTAGPAPAATPDRPSEPQDPAPSLAPARLPVSTKSGHAPADRYVAQHVVQPASSSDNVGRPTTRHHSACRTRHRPRHLRTRVPGGPRRPTGSCLHPKGEPVVGTKRAITTTTNSRTTVGGRLAAKIVKPKRHKPRTQVVDTGITAAAIEKVYGTTTGHRPIPNVVGPDSGGQVTVKHAAVGSDFASFLAAKALAEKVTSSDLHRETRKALDALGDKPAIAVTHYGRVAGYLIAPALFNHLVVNIANDRSTPDTDTDTADTGGEETPFSRVLNAALAANTAIPSRTFDAAREPTTDPFDWRTLAEFAATHPIPLTAHEDGSTLSQTRLRPAVISVQDAEDEEDLGLDD